MDTLIAGQISSSILRLLLISQLKAGVEGDKFKIHTPIIGDSKAGIIKKGLALGVDYSLTTSRYNPSPEAFCLKCDSCHLRMEGFEANGMKDPLI